MKFLSSRDPVRIAQRLIAESAHEPERLGDILQKVCTPDVWSHRLTTEGKPFHTFAEFVTALPPSGLGVQTQQALLLFRSAFKSKGLFREWAALLEGLVRQRGRPKKNIADSDNYCPRFNLSRSSTSSDRNLLRPKMHHPHIFEDVCNMKCTVHEGAKRAGLVRSSSRAHLSYGACDLDAVCRLGLKARRKLLGKVFEATGRDAQCWLLATKIEPVLGLQLSGRWRAHGTTSLNQFSAVPDGGHM